MRKDGGLHATDWDEAFARVLSILRGASGKAVALVSPGTIQYVDLDPSQAEGQLLAQSAR